MNPSSRALAALVLVSVACGTTGTGSAPQQGEAADPRDPGSSGAPAAPGSSGGTPASPDGGQTSTVPPADPGTPHVRFVGRFDDRDPSGPSCGWPGCRIVARFEGTALSVRFEERLQAWMEGGPSAWDVSIDGVAREALVLAPGTADYLIATDLPAGPHAVELYKRSESQNGDSRFLGFDFGAGGKLLPPGPARTRKIEIVGDSSVAGFGVEGVGPDCDGPDWGARWQNFRKSAGARLAEMVHADLHGTVYSGKGVMKNIWRTDTATMPILYQRANAIDPTSTWDPTKFVPDVIVVFLGGNDFEIGQPTDDGGATLAEFTAAYRTFVATLRSQAPQARIILGTSPSLSDAQPAGRASRTNVLSATQAIANERNAAGDQGVVAFEPPVATPHELTACNGHGTSAFHERVAQQLAAIVRAKTGWN